MSDFNVNDVPIFGVIDHGKRNDGECVAFPATHWNLVICRPQVTNLMSELGIEPFNFLITDYVEMTSDELNNLIGYDYY